MVELSLFRGRLARSVALRILALKDPEFKGIATVTSHNRSQENAGAALGLSCNAPGLAPSRQMLLALTAQDWAADSVVQTSLQQDGTWADRSERWLVDRRSFLLAGLLGLGGCQSWIARGQSPETKPGVGLPGDDTTYVGDMTRVWGAAPAIISGVGMVSELSGTGSAPAPSRYRDELTEDLRTREVQEPNQLLSADWTSLVVLKGLAPAGARKGQNFDVFVTLDPGSLTTSLESGFLMPARMTPKQQVRTGEVLAGRLAATATGPVLIDQLFGSEKPNALVSGVVPGGGAMMVDRPFGLQTKDEHQSIREAMLVTKSINGRFNYFENAQRHPVAKAKNDRVIELVVPTIYQDNVTRYLHVLRNVAIDESPSKQVNRLELLEQRLQDPATAEVASLRLEAIGENGVAILERALRSSNEKVRFVSALALTYQGKNSACEELGRLAASQWAFRWHALTALSAIPDSAARNQLRQMLQAQSVETRYGAVRCLTQRGENDAEMVIESFGKNGENFSLNTVFSTSEPVVHIARFKKPEIVIFNPDQKILPGFLFVGNGWTIKSGSDQSVEISHFRSNGGDKTVRCTSDLTDLIRTLAQMEITYSLVIQILKQAAAEKLLDGRLVINALPKPNRTYTPNARAAGDGSTPGSFSGDQEDGEQIQGGAMPEMFQGEMESAPGELGSSEMDPDIAGMETGAEDASSTASVSKTSKASAQQHDLDQARQSNSLFGKLKKSMNTR